MDSQTKAEHIQIRLISKIEKYAKSEAAFSLPSESGCSELSSILHALLIEQGVLEENEEKQFDFLVRGELLRTTLSQFMEQNEISTETVVDVEFIIKQPSPTPEKSILHSDWVSCLQATDNYVLAGCYDNTVKINSFDGKELLTLAAHTAPLRCLCWIDSSDKDKLTFVTGSHDQLLHVWQWEPATGAVKCLYNCAGHQQSLEGVAVSPDRLQFASVSRDALLKIWTMDERGVSTAHSQASKKPKLNEPVTKVPLMTLSGHDDETNGVCWIDHGVIVTAGFDHTIRLWDLETQTNSQTMRSSKAILSIDWSPVSGRFITGSCDRHIRLWDSRIQDTSMVIGNFSSHSSWVSSVKWSKDDENLFISGSYDCLAKLWDARSPKAPLYDLSGHDDKVLAVDWSNPHHMLSGGADNAVNIFSYAP